ncbi:CHAD domain-containing protein [Mesorhizobium soli]|uniref:CHAD domain-containing protein n=1 Tax=Pseudaminobacter soli (ex Li et al. 2025) TaxID=1295366 RepID=UPI0024730EC5|nr:CHAD domain-containing protein [Mesorhizobium soli]MDH6231954.1 CHAD domain-containing protein [Mesorhizobium soli]
MSYRIARHLPLADEFRRIADLQVCRAMGNLEDARSDPETMLHECRKRFKKVRALLRLVRRADKGFFRTENARYRDTAHTLASGRKATALIETVDRLIDAYPKATGSGELDGIRTALVMRREARLREEAGMERRIDAGLAACRIGRAQIRILELPDEPDDAADVIAAGVKKVLRKAVRAYKAARKDGTPEQFHELRKGVKNHWMHLQLLRAFWPSPAKRRRKAAHKLGQRLGDLHDLDVLKRLVEREGDALGSREEIEQLRRVMARSDKSLRKRCLRKAKRLLDKDARKMPRKVAKNYAARAAAA